MSIAAAGASVTGVGRAVARRARGSGLLLAFPATLLVAMILGLPLVLLFRYSLNHYDRYDMMREALTLDNYAAIFRDAFFRNVLMRTIVVAVISTAVALVLALPVAYFIARAPARFKSALIILVVFPLLVGNLVRAAGWMAVMGNRGFVNQLLLGFGLIEQPLEILYTPTAVVIGIIAVVLPFMTLTLQSVLEQIDPSLEEAAGSLGARPFTAFRRVVLPLAMPGVIAGSVLVFILCMNAYATPVLLGGPRFHMMAPQVYEQITGQSNWPFGGALAFILMGTTLALTVASTQLMQRSYARRALWKA